ncbi:metallophosphoesterase [Piscibacillus salipiscarius]|uniref:metallophosphoesterase n=1 Tax=Piscibacillus salipiscarius TaxID=299480 RepID=UPI000A674D7A|nr:metallophosphoesterase [Piscibacillus salipiscarius]
MEPRWLNIVQSVVKSKRIPKSFNDFKIVQITDTHIGFQYKVKELRKLINTVNNQNPDLVVFTGDLTDNPSKMEEFTYQEIISVMSKIKAPYGKYWIYGNHDHGGYGTDHIREVMKDSGFKLLQNETTKISINQDYINLSGLDDILLGKPEPSTLIPNAEKEQFNVLLCHEPDFAKTMTNYPFDLQLSGHSHGGQIQLPFIGYIVTPHLGTEYVEGSFELGERPLKLYVSRGLGTTRLPFRFLCRPEINVYTLQSNSV